jgi:hypothetical protein
MSKVLRWTKIRAFIGAVFAIAVLIGFIAVGAALFGVRLPILSGITDAFGIGAR